ncbi:MAG: hypothetical protein JST00_09335 [Deltaproteobacteria bacterium]|nr:hypothetical protein [Deltaproteobacteria bacterium]
MSVAVALRALPIVLAQAADPASPAPPASPAAPPAAASSTSPPASAPIATDAPTTPPPSTPAASAPSRPEAEAQPDATATTGIGFAAVLGLSLSNLAVDLPSSKQTPTSGGAFVHLGLSGFWRVLSLRLRLSGVVGGGGAGYLGAYSAEAWVGAGARITKNDQLFFRVGFDGYAFKNDELEASTGSVPGFAVGYQFWADGLGFEIAPRISLTPRSEYEPGDEALGRRHWRRLDARLGYGGAATITSKYFFLDGSLLRVADSDPLTVVDGRLCILPLHVAVCAFGQYWRSIATPSFVPANPAAALPTEIPSVYLGGSIGIGIAGSDEDRLRWF